MHVIIRTKERPPRTLRSDDTYWFECELCPWEVAPDHDWENITRTVEKHLRSYHNVRDELYMTANTVDGLEYDEPTTTFIALEGITISGGSIISPNVMRMQLNMPIFETRDIWYVTRNGRIKHLGPCTVENQTVAIWLAKTRPEWVLFFADLKTED